MLVMCEPGVVAERVGVGQQAVVTVVFEAGDRAEGVDLRHDLGAFVDHEALRVTETVGDGGHAQAGVGVGVVPGEVGFEVPVAAGLVDAAVMFVVDVLVPAAVGVRPRGDAAQLVAVEAQGAWLRSW